MRPEPGLRRAIGISVVVGVAAGVCLLEIWWLGAMLLALMAAAPPRPATAGGALVGSGVSSGILLSISGADCSSDQSCSAPDLTGWVTLAVGLAVAGILLLVVALRRR